MLVGKRSTGGREEGGSIVKRTSSMSGINIELSNSTETQEEASDNSIDTPHFLTTCRLCHRRLAAGRDIYMYRGDTAFCSLECREEQMKQDERKDKWNKVNSKKQQDPSPPSSAKTHTLAAS